MHTFLAHRFRISIQIMFRIWHNITLSWCWNLVFSIFFFWLLGGGGQWVFVGLCYIHRCCSALGSGQQCFCCNVDSDDLQFIILVTTYDELPKGTISIISVMILSCSAMSISVFLGIHELTIISFGV